MTAIWDYRPEVAAAVADGSFGVGLPDADLASLRRINDEIGALAAPLSRVSSLSEAEALATAGETEYRRLGEQWVAMLHDLDVSPSEFAEAEKGKIPSVQRVVLPDNKDNEQWQGVLDSEEGYVAWIERQLIEEQTDDERQKNDVLAKETRGSFLRYLLVKRALVSALASVPGPSPQTISVLTALADKCMTEVEDMFLAEADYGDDDGQTVPLAEVRADLGL